MQKTDFPVIWAMFYLLSINIPLKYRKAESKSNFPVYKSWKWNQPLTTMNPTMKKSDGVVDT